MYLRSVFKATIVAFMVLSTWLVMAEPYQTPSAALAKLVDQPRAPQTRVSDDHQWLAILELASNPSIADLSQKEMRLAGLRISPDLLASTRNRNEYTAITLVSLASGESEKLNGLPPGKYTEVQFSPDNKHLSFLHKAEDGHYLYIYNIKKQSLKKLFKQRLNTVIGTGYVWLYDGSAVLTRIEPKSVRLPAENPIPKGPTMQESRGDKAAIRTYQDLLSNADDEAWFDALTTTQLISINLTGTVTPLGKPGVIMSYTPSPDNQYILVQQILRPYSYLVPYYRFAKKVEAWDRNGQFVKVIAELALAENLPQGFDAVRLGRRGVQWRTDQSAALVWAEALDGGDMKKEQQYHDQVFNWQAPFNGKPTMLFATEMRFNKVQWGENNLAVFSEWRFSDRKMRAWKFNSKKPEEKSLWQDRSYRDVYNDPGKAVLTQSRFGTHVIKVVDNESIYLTGDGASPKGNVPFLDKYDFKKKKSLRLWQSEEPAYESVVAVLSNDAKKLLTSRESVKEPVNYYVRELSVNTLKPLTSFVHPTPEFLDVKKEFIKYTRADGVELSGMLYLPVGYTPEQGKLPVLMWAYPREYKDAAVAGQVRTSSYKFKRISYWGPLPFLAKGFAVFDGPTMPIVGKGDAQPNDTYRQQLVMSAEAAVKILVDRGIADPKRIAIGGHSYGAFMAANLLAHSDIFAAGIARSGAYNRSLTPFGFQGEERHFWEAGDIYGVMSPFYHAEKVNEPMLMIHGEADNNSGTFPIQSERMYAAVKGLGGHVRLVRLPYESHRYTARESLLHMLWEEERWLEKHVKDKK